MIRYSLRCDNGHGFEGWFSSSADHDRQKEGGLIECPLCASHEISKDLMAPSVATSRSREERAERAAAAVVDSVSALAPAGLDPEKREMLRQLREMRDKILSGTENVGERFSEEARKIHYGETEARAIRGQASAVQAAELIEEGIDFLAIPDLPDDRN